jgi:hypothetical protein
MRTDARFADATTDLPALMDMDRARELLGMSRSAVYRAAAAGHLSTLRFGRRVYVPTPGSWPCSALGPRRSREGQRPQTRRDLDLVPLGTGPPHGQAASAHQGRLPHQAGLSGRAERGAGGAARRHLRTAIVTKVRDLLDRRMAACRPTATGPTLHLGQLPHDCRTAHRPSNRWRGASRAHTRPPDSVLPGTAGQRTAGRARWAGPEDRAERPWRAPCGTARRRALGLPLAQRRHRRGPAQRHGSRCGAPSSSAPSLPTCGAIPCTRHGCCSPSRACGVARSPAFAGRTWTWTPAACRLAGPGWSSTTKSTSPSPRPVRDGDPWHSTRLQSPCFASTEPARSSSG